MTTFLKLYDRFLFDSFKLSDRDLSLYRVFFCAASFIFYGFPNLLWISGNSEYIFFPPKYSLVALTGVIPPYGFFYVLNISIVVLYIALLFGWYTRLVSVLLSLFLIISYNYVYSFGKIDHNIMLVLTPGILAFSGWGNRFSIDEKEGRIYPVNTWLISLLAFGIGFAMFTAAVPKIARGWLSLDSFAVKAYMQSNVIFYEGGAKKQPLLLDQLLSTDNFLFWESMDWLTILFEAGFLIAILSPFIFRIFIISALFFHTFVYLTFSIVFTGNLLVYALFLNWSIFYFISEKKVFARFFSMPVFLGALALFAVFRSFFISNTLGVKGYPPVRHLIQAFIPAEIADRAEILFLFSISFLLMGWSVVKYLNENKAGKKEKKSVTVFSE